MGSSDDMGDLLFYRRRLPHIHPANATFFITSRVAGSLPKHAIAALREEQLGRMQRIESVKDEEEKLRLTRELHERYFGHFDDYVDRISTGPRWLTTPAIAAIIKEALHFRDGKVYDLLCYTIMPNHTHLLFSVQRTGSSLNKILQSLNRHTAREANKILNRQGAFWHHESYDHVVRDEADLERIVHYILYNPVKAGLCKTLDEWNWSYLKAGPIDFD
jgi:putative transposase